MSTRGSVAWIDKNGAWRGVYNHHDSYPTGLGREVFEKCKTMGIGNVKAALQQYGDWREMLSGGICEYCGKCAGQPHSISVGSRNGNGFPDPEAKFHSHGRGRTDQFDPRRDPLFMEWVYVLHPADNRIDVWHFVNSNRRNKSLPTTRITHDEYTHVLVDSWNIGGEAPNFAEVAERAHAVREVRS